MVEAKGAQSSIDGEEGKPKGAAAVKRDRDRHCRYLCLRGSYRRIRVEAVHKFSVEKTVEGGLHGSS